uniref:Uncharacterized protein n=1 Tax=Globodera rostochiensis TaxID=31243 RepID=A0A914GUV0_GLORO
MRRWGRAGGVGGRRSAASSQCAPSSSASSIISVLVPVVPPPPSHPVYAAALANGLLPSVHNARGNKTVVFIVWPLPNPTQPGPTRADPSVSSSIVVDDTLFTSL